MNSHNWWDSILKKKTTNNVLQSSGSQLILCTRCKKSVIEANKRHIREPVLTLRMFSIIVHTFYLLWNITSNKTLGRHSRFLMPQFGNIWRKFLSNQQDIYDILFY